MHPALARSRPALTCRTLHPGICCLVGAVAEALQAGRTHPRTPCLGMRASHSPGPPAHPQVICFAFHDSSLLLETCQQARAESKIVTQFFLD